MIKRVALGVTLKNTHRQVLIDQLTAGKKGMNESIAYNLSDYENGRELGTIIFDQKKDNWDYKGPLSSHDLYQIARFIQNYNDDDWNF
ncbi:MAG TPA: hypothetical protein VHC47_02680 [Mucilaginibacter sp.]|nr:hypothetical protein [Mucilaginibacter sp.]